jgi:hypothetical protein
MTEPITLERAKDAMRKLPAIENFVSAGIGKRGDDHVIVVGVSAPAAVPLSVDGVPVIAQAVGQPRAL